MNAAILLALMPLVELLVVAITYVITLLCKPQNIKCSFGKFIIEVKFSTKASKPR